MQKQIFNSESALEVISDLKINRAWFRIYINPFSNETARATSKENNGELFSVPRMSERKEKKAVAKLFRNSC